MEDVKQGKPGLFGKLKTGAGFSGFKMRGSRLTDCLWFTLVSQFYQTPRSTLSRRE